MLVSAVHCPKCRNATTLSDAGDCLICGFCVQAVQLRTLKLHVILVAITIATVILGVIVLIAEYVGPPRPSAPAYLVYIFAALAAIIALISLFVVRPLMLQRPGSQAVLTSLLIQAALAEGIPVLGLLLYFMLGSVKWFVIFLAAGWLVFTVIGLRLADTIAEYEQRLVTEMEQQGPR